jgi:hypothetical protein
MTRFTVAMAAAFAVMTAGLVVLRRGKPQASDAGVWMSEGEMTRLGVVVGQAEVRDVDDTVAHVGAVVPLEGAATVGVVIDVTLTELSSLKVGARAVATVAGAEDAPFDGGVEWIGGLVDAKQAVQVRCGFIDRGGLLAHANRTRVEVSVGQHPAIAIPRKAVLRERDSAYVFVEVERTAHATRFMAMPITTEEATAMPWLPLPHGMEPGTRVVVGGAGVLARRLAAPSS